MGVLESGDSHGAANERMKSLRPDFPSFSEKNDVVSSLTRSRAERAVV